MALGTAEYSRQHEKMPGFVRKACYVLEATINLLKGEVANDETRAIQLSSFHATTWWGTWQHFGWGNKVTRDNIFGRIIRDLASM